MKYKSLIFLHLPKTGGITLISIIRQNCDLSRYFNVHCRTHKYAGMSNVSADFFKKSVDHFLARRSQHPPVKTLTGHQMFGLHRYLPQPCAYITLLREPVDRLVSQYYFIRESADHWLHQRVVGEKMSLYDFAISGIPELSNDMTRLVSGEETPDLEKAKRHLKDRFVVCGITERFNESVALMATRLGWQHTTYKKLNVTRRRISPSSISPLERGAILAANRMDVELYQFATELFTRQLGQS